MGGMAGGTGTGYVNTEDERLLHPIFKIIAADYRSIFPNGIETLDTTGRGPIKHGRLQGPIYRIELKFDQVNEHLTYLDSATTFTMSGNAVEGYAPTIHYQIHRELRLSYDRWLRLSGNELANFVRAEFCKTSHDNHEINAKLPESGDREKLITDFLLLHMGVK